MSLLPSLTFQRVSSPLGDVLEWEAQSEEIGDADSSPRVPSTDWTTLETSLEFWHKEHSRVSHCEDEEESFSKVRYNDTGSLEEVINWYIWNIFPYLVFRERNKKIQ